MIKDKLVNINRYRINEFFELFTKFINSSDDLLTIPPPFKAIPIEYQTKDFDLSKFENHRKYIDVHYIIHGSELIGLANIQHVKPNMDYDELHDYQLFDGIIKEKILLQEGEFLILFEDEPHVTGGFVEKNGNGVKKIVFKIPYNA
jgi:YhcH/YjgK/YiaL family protein